ncbi:MAG: hypothetical protein WC822_02355 [Candidatus Paceibacterota bacterium]
MKKLLAVLLFVPSLAVATPYFRLLDPAHPHVSAGIFLDPTSSVVDYGSMIAIVTHSPADGTLIPSVPMHWTPLAIGGGYGNGKGIIAFGPSFNAAPLVKAFILRGVSLITEDDNYASFKELLAPKIDGGPDITVAYGYACVINAVEGGVFVPIDKYRAQSRFYAGAAWNF